MHRFLVSLGLPKARPVVTATAAIVLGAGLLTATAEAATAASAGSHVTPDGGMKGIRL